MNINNKTYDILKTFAQIVLPALATLYFALSEAWGLGFGAEVVATITALDTFLGVFLGLNTKTYRKSENRFDGKIGLKETEDKKSFTLNVNNPYSMKAGDEILFKVENE
jgi:hypothetical protein